MLLDNPIPTPFDNFKTIITENINLVKTYIDNYQATYLTNKAALTQQVGQRASAGEDFTDLINQIAQLDFENNSLKAGWRIPIDDLSRFWFEIYSQFSSSY